MTTVSIDVHSTGISLPIAIRVNLSWVVLVGAVVAAVTNIIFVMVKLPGVEQEGAVVLKGMGREK